MLSGLSRNDSRALRGKRVVRTDDLDLAPETTGFVRRALHYYVPCVVRGRMVAVIGLGRSADGALLRRKTSRFCELSPDMSP